MAKNRESLSVGSRLWLALIVPWRLLFDGLFAAKVAQAQHPQAQLPEAPKKPEPQVTEAEPDSTTALQLLAILQREGRFIDFLKEPVSEFSDAEIGAAARVVHEGCERGLKDYVEFVPVRSEDEGAQIVLEPGFDAAKTRVTGNVVGDPPFTGKLAHHGWRARSLRFPQLTKGHDPHILAPAEIEL